MANDRTQTRMPAESANYSQSSSNQKGKTGAAKVTAAVATGLNPVAQPKKRAIGAPRRNVRACVQACASSAQESHQFKGLRWIEPENSSTAPAPRSGKNGRFGTPCWNDPKRLQKFGYGGNCMSQPGAIHPSV